MDRYLSFNSYLRSLYGVRVQRIPVNLGLGCPHRKNRTGEGGCIFCDRTGSGVLPPHIPVREQVLKGMEFAKRRYKARLFMVYFQAFCNTYAPADELERLYSEALIDPSIVGVMVGTRPDLVPDDVLYLLHGLSFRYQVWLELGLQSCHNRTLRLINRRHDVSCFVDAVLRAKGYGLKVCAHVILGLPGEGLEEMLETALFLSSLPVDGVKIHNLHVLRDTPLERMYLEGGLRLLTLEEYVDACVSFIEHLRGDIVIQRLTGEAPADRLVAPEWCLDKAKVISLIRQRLEELDTFQGAKCPYGRP